MSEEINTLIEGFLKRKQEEKAETFRELLDKQESSCMNESGNKDMYEIGLYNGLALGLAILMNEEPKFYGM